MVSVLGKLICRELGREKYNHYLKCLDEKQSTEIFCDIYFEICQRTEVDRAQMLLHLLDTVHLSIRISRHFYLMVLSYVIFIIGILILLPFNIVMMGAFSLATICILYKLVEFLINRYCDRDIRMILIYKCVLFYLLGEDSGNLT